MFYMTIARSPAKLKGLAESQALSRRWMAGGAGLQQPKLGAILLCFGVQVAARLAITGNGKLRCQHFAHGFVNKLAGMDFELEFPTSKRTKVGMFNVAGVAA